MVINTVKEDVAERSGLEEVENDHLQTHERCRSLAGHHGIDMGRLDKVEAQPTKTWQPS
jgi:hypothetical protein